MVSWSGLAKPPRASVVPERTYRAPGRVNLIGDHTDYNEGFVLPLAVDFDCVVRAQPREDGRVVLIARSISCGRGRRRGGWKHRPDHSGSVLGTVRRRSRAHACRAWPRGGGYRRDDHVHDSAWWRALVQCCPRGRGLPSRSATPLTSRCRRSSLRRPARQRRSPPRACHAGSWTSLPRSPAAATGPLLIDCRSLEIEHISLPPRLAVLVINSGMPRQLVDSAYAERRHACEAAAARPGPGRAPRRDPGAGRRRASCPPRRLRERTRLGGGRGARSRATSRRWGGSSPRATRACATTSRSQRRSWTCSSRSCSRRVRSARGSRAPASAVASSDWGPRKGGRGGRGGGRSLLVRDGKPAPRVRLPGGRRGREGRVITGKSCARRRRTRLSSSRQQGSCCPTPSGQRSRSLTSASPDYASSACSCTST